MVIIWLSVAPALVGLLYALLEHFGTLDRITGRAAALEGLHRLKSPTGYPLGWIYDDAQDAGVFRALTKRISPRIKDPPVREALDAGHSPTLITTGGSPIVLEGIPPEWAQAERAVYIPNHPVMYVFGVRRGQAQSQGKVGKACTLGELESWLVAEKEARKFWVGSLMVVLLSVAVILFRLSLAAQPSFVKQFTAPEPPAASPTNDRPDSVQGPRSPASVDSAADTVSRRDKGRRGAVPPN